MNDDPIRDANEREEFATAEGDFTEWVATRKPCADLGAHLQDELLMGVPGFLYEGECYIKDMEGLSPERYHLLIERQEWWSNDLPALERILYFEWARSELLN